MKIGYAFCGSFCTFERSINALRSLAQRGEEIIPIMSFNAAGIDTRFGRADDFKKIIREVCKRDIIETIEDAEPLGPRIPLDLLIVSPCTGNTLAKLANGITDTPVTMAVKAHLRCDRPLLIALASNDALSANLANISAMLKRKGVYFVPMVQDDPQNKPHSLGCNFEMLERCAFAACRGEQIRPLFD